MYCYDDPENPGYCAKHGVLWLIENEPNGEPYCPESNELLGAPPENTESLELPIERFTEF